MAIDQDHDFMDAADRVEAQKEARRVSLIGIAVALILGFGLVSLLFYGRILTDHAPVASTPPAVVTTPATPTPAPTNVP
jgi:hypothetical protein